MTRERRVQRVCLLLINIHTTSSRSSGQVRQLYRGRQTHGRDASALCSRVAAQKMMCEETEGFLVWVEEPIEKFQKRWPRHARARDVRHLLLHGPAAWRCHAAWQAARRQGQSLRRITGNFSSPIRSYKRLILMYFSGGHVSTAFSPFRF